MTGIPSTFVDAPRACAPPDVRRRTESPGIARRLRLWLFGPPRDLRDRHTFTHLSVVALLAWVGLGADGLSSSAYGPEEALRALDGHTYLAVPLAALTIGTVLVISGCYGRIIARFPQGGGGYLVATSLLGENAGLVSGSALLIDYVFTVTISIAAAGDALFSFLPVGCQALKLPGEAALLLGLTVLNLRGVKESILALVPVFVLFLITHAVLIFGGLLVLGPSIPTRVDALHGDFRAGLSTLGLGGMFCLLLHAYSLGGGTYTGIEAVSNGLGIMAEPRVRTARTTMAYMAASLSVTAAGLLLCYVLGNVQAAAGKTLNAVLLEGMAERFSLGAPFVVLTLLSEGALLVVAAQAGFIDGPRVLANLACDSWVPRRFAALSDRLAARNGIWWMGGAAGVALLLTGGDVRTIVVMYSINVFLTFSLSMLGMLRAVSREPRPEAGRQQEIRLFRTGFLLCATILAVTVVEKAGEGGWIALVATGMLALACRGVRRHYRGVDARLAALLVEAKPAEVRNPSATPRRVDPTRPTAAVLVGAYGGLGVRTVEAVLRDFPGRFRNVLFLSVGVVDSAAMRGEETMDVLRERTRQGLRRYAALAESRGKAAGTRAAIGTDVTCELEKLCLEVAKEHPRITFFAGQLVLEGQGWLQSLLHNNTAFELQRRLHAAGHSLVIVPTCLPRRSAGVETDAPAGAEGGGRPEAAGTGA